MKNWKKTKALLSLATVLAMLLSMMPPALAASYSAVTTISSSTTSSGQSYSSTSAPENAILVTGGASTLTSPTVTKSGSPSGNSDDYDFYGTNAAVVATGGTLNISGGTVTTSGAYANAVYAHDSGVINVEDTEITTSAHNSGGVMVTGGGTLTAANVTVTTSSGSSAAIRSDRGGGVLTVVGGSFTTSGQGSPAIYSTADITVSNAALISTHSEGVVVEGGNSVTLDNVTLTDTNDTLNGQSTTYKNIFLYQSMSGDASSGSSTFTAKNSDITTNQGDTFYATNITTTITLENNTIKNNNSSSSYGGYFLRSKEDSWGRSGSNGGNVTLNMTNQDADGDIYIDSISTLSMNLSNGSAYTGTINGDNTASRIALTLDADSTIALTGDSYVTSFSNSDSTNSNITLNGHSLYVNGTAITVSDSGDDAGDVDDVENTYNLSETDTVTISEDGTYTITGTTADGSITVKKGVTATLHLTDASITSATDGKAPLTCNKGSHVTLVISGVVTLTDDENPENSDSEGAAIKVKAGGVLTISGSGVLNVNGNCKNGIKGAGASYKDDGTLEYSGTKVTIAGATVNVNAENNGAACDNAVEITGGVLNITAGNDGIKAEPDEEDTDSAGTVTISGGSITVSTTGTDGGDGVQATGDLTISGGTLNVTTMGGCNGGTFDEDTMSAKGLKSDSDILVSGGTFTLNCADDAVHADGNVTITGGTFTDIRSGDDGIHADYVLTIGTQGANSGPSITVSQSVEGLEGAAVNLYSGSGDVTASDDGVNAANGDLSGYAYHLNIAGGTWLVNASADCLDTNGNLTVTGGETILYGPLSQPEVLLDYVGTFTITGGTILAMGQTGLTDAAEMK